jgi:DNA polymerase-3 subunit gamma/tau
MDKEKVVAKEELYRKYRPQTFDEIVGNKMAIKTIRHELKHGAHVFLMTGPAGTGKTTLARIMAKYLDAGPLSIREINSAENRGIDSAREIMDSMRYNPSDGDSMVWILDEFHQQTKPAQEAFLKAFEDTPSHVYFFICTTNPEKLIVPLKSRCSIVNMKPLKNEEMESLLVDISGREGIEISLDVTDRITTLANGGSRTALKLLGKVLYLETDKDRIRALKDMSGGDDAKETIDFCRAIYKRCSFEAAMGLLAKMDLAEPEKIRFAVLGYGNAILTRGLNKYALKVMEAFSYNTYDSGKFALTLMIADALGD